MSWLIPQISSFHFYKIQFPSGIGEKKSILHWFAPNFLAVHSCTNRRQHYIPLRSVIFYDSDTLTTARPLHRCLMAKLAKFLGYLVRIKTIPISRKQSAWLGLAWPVGPNGEQIETKKDSKKKSNWVNQRHAWQLILCLFGSWPVEPAQSVLDSSGTNV